VIVAENTKPPEYENVLRAYMAKTNTSTSLYQAWLKAKNDSLTNFEYSGRTFTTDDLYPNCKLPEIIDTPSTKAGDDITKSPQWFFDNGIITEGSYLYTKESSIKAFNIVSEYLKSRGLLLVDTKTEHGQIEDGQHVLIDEAYTMDSSRIWLLDDKGEILLVNGEPVQIGKENARKKIKNKGQLFTEDEANQIAFEYVKGLQMITGKRFVPDIRPRVQRYRDALDIIWRRLDL
jgi:phosphoribosylaminoimidazole-succinocarboxamide synthase